MNQKFPHKELIISDDLNDKRVEQLCKELDNPRLKIIYTVAPNQGISHNLNHAITNASGKVIKILFQDDFLVNRFALLFLFLRLLFSRKQWHVSGSVHFKQSTENFYKVFRPRVSNNLLDGKNFISSPSVVTLKRKSQLGFDSRLTYLLDCEWYLRMSHSFGLPIFGRLTLVANRIHKGQATNWAKHRLKFESTLAKEIHDVSYMKATGCKCTKTKLVASQ